MNKEYFGARIREARRKAKLSSEMLAEICDCTAVSIRQIESGVRLPSLPKLIALCNALRVTPNELLGPELLFPFDSDVPANPRIDDLSMKIRRLPSNKQNIVFSVVEPLLDALDAI